MYDGHRGVDTFLVRGGKRTHRHTDANDCPAGTDIWVPRSQQILNKAASYWGTTAWNVGLFSMGSREACCEGLTESGAIGSDEWTTVATPVAPWFVRTASAPSTPTTSSYHGGCWLQPTGLGADGLSLQAGVCGGFDSCKRDRTERGALPSPLRSLSL